MPQIDLPQGRIDFLDEGPSDAPAIVFVHGYSVDHTLWAQTATALVADGFRCLRPTLPLGSHTTPCGNEALTPRVIADMVASFCSQLGLEDVTLVGNDSGGAISQMVVDAHPRRIGRLVLTNCDTFDRFPPPPFGLLVTLARRGLLHRVLRVGDRTGLNDRIFGLLTTRGFARGQVRAWVRPYLENPAIRRETDAFIGGADGAELLGVSTRLGRFDRPVLFVWGARDRFFRLKDARRLAAIFPDARVEVLPEARTFVALDEPVRLAELIAEHVRAGAPAPGAGAGAGAPTPA